MSNSYGITSAGFFAKPVTQILAEIVADELATVDPALDTSPENPIGQLNGVMAEKLGEVWELAAVAYNSINPDDAEGNQLDNVCALTGTLRAPPLPSSVYCNVTLAAANSPYNAGTLVAAVAGQPGVQFSNAQAITVPSDGTYSAFFTSVEDGPIAATAGTLTVISTPVTGWTVVTNPLSAVLGTLEELDPALRQRREEELSAAGSGTVDAITADLLEIDGGSTVLSVTILENLNNFTDANGTPAYAMQPVVWDGLFGAAPNNDIAQSLWNDKPGGTPYYGTTSGVAVDIQGNQQTVSFSRPSQVPIYLAFTVTFTQGLSGALQTQAIAGVKTAATNFSLANNAVLQPGIEVVAMSLRAAALAVPGIFDVPSLALDIVASPTATANIPISPLSVAVIQTPNITVNGS